MKSFKLSARPFSFLYFIFMYVFAFAVWWTYLHLSKNQSEFDQAYQFNKLKYEIEHHVDDRPFDQTAMHQQLKKKFSRQQIMILSEGGAFLLILLIGFLKIRKNFKKEIALAKQQKNFLLSITHELKSPLASIKLGLETLGKHSLDKEKQQQIISNSLSDTDRLEKLVENILLAAQMEQDTFVPTLKEIDLNTIASSVIQKLSSTDRISNRLISELQATYALIHADSLMMVSLITNLIENALKYSTENVIVSTFNEDGNVYLQVKDFGIGISTDERKKIFQKFYRIGNEETRMTKGTGLGLYIVKRVLEYHKGEIEVSLNKPNGSIFSCKFPQREA